MRNIVLGVVCCGLVAGMLATDVRAQAPFGRVQRVQDDGFAVTGGPGSSIGLSVRDATADEARTAKLPQASGAVVVRVVPGSPAEKAGIAAGDVVTEFDGERVRSARQLSRLVRETPPGRTVKGTVVRNGAQRNIEVTPDNGPVPFVFDPQARRDLEEALKDLPRRFDFQFDGQSFWDGGRGRLGAELFPLREQLASYFGAKRGVLVSSVQADSPAARAGLKAGDVITAVNGRSVESAGDVTSEVRRADAGAALTLTVVRDKKELSLTARLPDAEQRRARRGRAI